MKTTHTHYIGSAVMMKKVADRSVGLVVTSPPYPMIDMWDEIFSRQDRKIEKALKRSDGILAFELMHQVLDRVWKEVFRVLSPGGFACINIGDATRTIGDNFALYPNHARILTATQALGFTALPCILWRKQTNAPNKFMGSGMLPAGAYVTLEHEYILILRKGGKREFTSPATKENRRQSALFWEERNQWFSDIWMDLKGTRQAMGKQKKRNRSGAFPFDLAYRLINMYSVKQDLVLDPFLGTGTTTLAAMTAGRNSAGYEIDPSLLENFYDKCKDSLGQFSSAIQHRIDLHNEFVQERLEAGKLIKHENAYYGFPVITRQEKELVFSLPVSVEQQDDERIVVNYDVPSRETATTVTATPQNTPAVSRPSGAKSKADGLLFPDFDPGS
ncbi:site-specific DNA-methyltransferase [Desulfobacter hydrogenophilus]|uniref:Methyltransferase n=1 Tax=Desulfobacter hydrogenophilus TaxID=2291 RepID=A0A328FKC1_9BACT|nr:site-specific DNA-methyltransferase [Desulfobacter hydrogenophilus]NDY72313.1 site-specific DNA-methyltransferase [Desulfobacter hydrogenophilus]QBH12939.1 site-specific DNA-methyltransferase [Desulfobacter hydrogenophilus]RAM03922.1 site-specific DNA-methyltransferase [Desulfobacter hydrogenophilus]